MIANDQSGKRVIKNNVKFVFKNARHWNVCIVPNKIRPFSLCVFSSFYTHTILYKRVKIGSISHACVL